LTTTARSALPAITRRAWLVLALTSVGQMLTTFAGSALNVGFPVISADLDVERTTLAWTISGYAIAAAALLLAAGRAADRIGGRRVFLGGLGLFTVGSILCALTPNVGVLIGARVLQGMGSAAMIPSSLSIALHEFPRERRSFAVAIWGAVAAIAGASGAPLGALLIELGDWRFVFVLLAVLGLSTMAASLRFLRDPPLRPSTGRVDLVSGPLASAAVGLVIAALLQSDNWGWTDRRVLAALAVAPVLLAIVVVRSRTHPNPLVDLRLFRHRSFVVASSMTTVYNAATGGYWLAAPLFLQTVWGWSVLASGLAIAPGPLVHLTTARWMGHLAEAGYHRLLMIGGTALTACGIGSLALFVTETSSYWTTILPAALVTGLGGAMAWPTFTSAALLDIPADQYGEANGVNLTMRQLGGAMGIAVVITVIGNRSDAQLSSFHAAWTLLAVALLAASLILAWAYPRRRDDPDRTQLV
jgi:EmrB/QacA subfamily drug resistance transporter